MRYLLILGGIVLALALVGCGSNPAASITGPANTTTAQTGQPVVQGQGSDGADEIIGPPKYVNLAPVSPPDETPEATPGFYGMVSNLNLDAGTFTLTSPSGKTLDVVASPGARVLYQGTFYTLADSPLKDGMNVSVTSAVSNLPANAKVRAALIVVNFSTTNQALVNSD